VLDDYSALRGLDESLFKQRLNVLSTTPGQQYDANQTPSTRFTGSGEFRAENEPYGVMITFMASGDDLPHPDQDAERERSIGQREKSSPAEDEDADDGKSDAPRVEMTIRNAAGELIRTRKLRVHQGVNRIVWGMEGDGVRPMPGPQAAELEDGLPGGAEVPPGEHEVMLHLAVGGEEPATTSSRVTVLADPRSTVSADARLRNYHTMLTLQEMQETAVSAVERIIHSRADIDTVLSLIAKKQKPGEEEDEAMKALSKQAAEVLKGLDALEKRFRTPPDTKGIVYDDDKVANMIGMAMNYVGSSGDAPTPTADVYIKLAAQTLDEAWTDLDRYMAEDLASFSRSVSGAGIGLFQSSALP
jgi:hypothetical protein